MSTAEWAFFVVLGVFLGLGAAAGRLGNASKTNANRRDWGANSPR